MNRTRSLRRSRHLLAAEVDDAPGPGYFYVILGDNGAAWSRSLGEALGAVNNSAAARQPGLQ